MASLGKREFAKKDMNFFSEFAASSQALARATGYLILGAIVIVGVLVAIALFQFFRLQLIKSDIKEYDEKFATPEYQNLQVEADNLAKELARINEKSYVINSMQATIDNETGAQLDLEAKIREHIPYDTVITSFSIEKDSVVITGQTFHPQSAYALQRMVSTNSIFKNANTNLKRIDPNDIGNVAFWMENFKNAEYEFEMTATVDVKYMVTKALVMKDNTIISAPTHELVEPNQTYTMTDIGTTTVNGKTYKLSSIVINGKAISKDEFKIAVDSNGYSVFINGDTKIQLYYTIEQVEQKEG